MDETMGMILSIKSSLAHYVLELIVVYRKLGETFGKSSFHLSNSERITRPKIGYAHGNH